ncbi:MAG: glycosyltransferase [Pelagibacterales bacterium]|nr:glycosyltransferase [Pelagibacterales bacterium]MBJ86063.1 glycosyltransferase [Pelagibacterales bacterium]|tara:strand:- start:17545 stop:18498 length:954 start_codon:yes stop_codon:yes gene_type:complete
MISVVIPIFNEEENINKLSQSIKKALSDIDYEVLFVNDGSTDNSENEIVKLSSTDPKIKLINLRRNYGQTAAMQAGFDQSKGTIVIPMDGDLQNDPKDIPKLIEKINEGYDVVSGWRKIRSDKKLTRILPSKIANMIISKISGIHLHDYGCTLKAYRKEILEDIKLYGEMHRFIPIYASWEGAKVTEIPVNHHPRIAGKTKYGLSRIPRVILDLLVIRFFDKSLDRPIHLFGQFGLLMFLIAFLLFFMALFLKVFMNISFILTPLPLLVVFFSMSGLLCIFLGLVAEIQSRIYFESKNRPPYLIKKNTNKYNDDKEN